MKDKILTGRIAGQNHYSTPDSIAATNSLVTGMTRSGKSYKLRTLAEAIQPHMPVWIIDPEDEFYTLREKYPFVLFGEGGEAPMTIQSARLVARRLLEWGVSGVLSLAALKEDQQHIWVYHFIDELMSQPRASWKRACIILDEAHLWAPNSGHGKSDALLAARNLARRGLKRGLIPVWATQRLAALSVAVSSSAENMMVGRTTRSADQEQAAKLLGVNKAGKAALAQKLRTCKRGNFYTVGPAYSDDIITLETIPAKTTHFSGKIGEDPEKMPLPKALHYLLPELEKLNAEIEVLKANSDETPEEELARLRVIVQERGEGGAAPVTNEQFASLEAQVSQDAIRLQLADEAQAKLHSQIGQITGGVGRVQQRARAIEETMTSLTADMTTKIEKLRASAQELAEEALGVLANGSPGAAASAAVSQSEETRSNISLNRREEAILKALREAEAMGMESVPHHIAAQMAGLSPGGQFWKNRGRLRKDGFIANRPNNCIALTPAGKVLVAAPQKPISQSDMNDRLRRSMGPDAFEIIHILVRRKGLWVSLEALRKEAKYGPSSDKFRKIVTKLRSNDIVEYRQEDKHVRVAERILVKEEEAA